MASCTILTLCLRLPLAISPWAFDDAYYLKETFLLVTCGPLLGGLALALWRGWAVWVGLPVPLLGFLVFATLSVWRVANIWAVAFRLALLRGEYSGPSGFTGRAGLEVATSLIN
jgi:hypothetical protein